MSDQFAPQVPNGGNPTGPLAQKTEVLKSAASEWAGSFKDTVRERLTDTGSKADTYVRTHPGRFIAGACCLGLAAGWLLGRQHKGGDS